MHPVCVDILAGAFSTDRSRSLLRCQVNALEVDIVARAPGRARDTRRAIAGGCEIPREVHKGNVGDEHVGGTAEGAYAPKVQVSDKTDVCGGNLLTVVAVVLRDARSTGRALDVEVLEAEVVHNSP